MVPPLVFRPSQGRKNDDLPSPRKIKTCAPDQNLIYDLFSCLSEPRRVLAYVPDGMISRSKALAMGLVQEVCTVYSVIKFS